MPNMKHDGAAVGVWRALSATTVQMIFQVPRGEHLLDVVGFFLLFVHLPRLCRVATRMHAWPAISRVVDRLGLVV